MKRFINKIANNNRQDSLAAKMRQKRFELFKNLCQSLPKPVNILDVGGTQRFWEVMNYTEPQDVYVTLLNLNKPEIKYSNFTSLAGDATNMQEFETDQFDVVFSNSVIEHVGNLEKQTQMAKEIQRVGKRYFVQTPNYFFPIEPHFLFPGFQWLPIPTRVFLLKNFNLGWVKKISDPLKAQILIEETRLLKKSELITLFPTATLYEEKILGLTKSLIVYEGW